MRQGAVKNAPFSLLYLRVVILLKSLGNIEKFTLCAGCKSLKRAFLVLLQQQSLMQFPGALIFERVI